MPPEEKPTREQAWQLVTQYITSENLLDHVKAVEGVMRYRARKFGEDEEMWGVVGLIHDLDYELYPEQHCRKIREILTDQGWPEAYIRAAESHGYGICTDVEPRSRLEQSLYAIDELTGLVSACALVRPSKSVKDMKVKSVRKKWKDASFAAGADREIISKGAAMLNEDLDDLFSDVIMGMREIADDIGL